MVGKQEKLPKVVVVGLGYVGLPTLVAIAASGKYEAVGFDVDRKKIEMINQQQAPIEDEMVVKYLKKGRLKVSDEERVLEGAKYYLVCVPTPINDDFSPDYSYVISAAKITGKFLTPGSHLIVESTVNPYACGDVVKPILERESGLKAGADFNLAHCPERINPGDEKWNTLNINRNIGSVNKKMNAEAADFYRSFLTKAKINEVDSLEVAEATKVVENTFRDINIAFVNELAKSFDAMGLDLIATMEAAANKPFSFMAHWPGAGVGGHCIAVDPYYLINEALRHGFDHQLVRKAREVNLSMPSYVVERLEKGLKDMGMKLNQAKVLLLGMSYKPNLGDMRESPAVKIHSMLKSKAKEVVVYDPYIEEYEGDLEKLLSQVEAVVIATAHDEYLQLDSLLWGKSQIKIVVDGRNCLDANKVKGLGIKYLGVGR